MVPCSLRTRPGPCSPLCVLLAFDTLVDGVRDIIPKGFRGSDLDDAWRAISKRCFQAIGEPETLTVRDAISEPLRLRAPTPVLSMAAIELMHNIELLYTAVDEWYRLDRIKGDKKATKAIYRVWLKVAGIIVYFGFPVHESSAHPDGNGGHWAVPLPSS